MSFKRRMEKENVLYLHNRIFVIQAFKKMKFKGKWIELEQITLSEVPSLRKTNMASIALYVYLSF